MQNKSKQNDSFLLYNKFKNCHGALSMFGLTNKRVRTNMKEIAQQD